MPERIARREGRGLFGCDAAAYDAGRPDYPEPVYRLLVERCGLAPGCPALEVGAGSGRVARRLLALGADPLVAVEPDPGFAAALGALARGSGDRLTVVAAAFEDAALEPDAFDLAVCATSLHWLDPEVGVRKLGACLRPGGWLAVFWNVFGDPSRPDPFHEATALLLADLARSPSQPERGGSFALDREARRKDFERAGSDLDFCVEEIHWTWTWSPEEVRALYATFSPIARLPEPQRARLLERIATVAAQEFGGVVERPLVTPVYLGRRRGLGT